MENGDRTRYSLKMMHEAILALVDPKGRLAVRVTANARANAVTVSQVVGSSIVLVRTTATPEHGEANQAVIKLLAKALDCPRSALTIVRGQTSRDKVVSINRA